MSDIGSDYWTLEEIKRVAAEEQIVFDLARITLGGIQSSGLSRANLVEGLRMLAAIPDEDTAS